MLQFNGNELTTVEAAKKVGCDPYVIRQAIKDGSLKAVNVGFGRKRPTWAIDYDDLKEWANGLRHSNREKIVETAPVVIVEDPKPVVSKPKAFVRNPWQEKYERLMEENQKMRERLDKLEDLENRLLEITTEIEELRNM